MSNGADGDSRAVAVTEIRVPPIVVEGIDVMVPEAPIGTVAMVVNARVLVAEVIPIEFPRISGGAALVTARGAYMGHSVKESTGGAGATLDIIDGTDAKGNRLCPLTLSSNESTRDWFPLPGIVVRRGLFVNVTAGSAEGTIYFGVPEGHGDSVLHELAEVLDALEAGRAG